MGATYTRQSSSAIVDGGIIEAADINAEFNQILAAFVASSGHTHDGTAAEGGPITKLLGTAITIGDGTAGTDIAVTFDGETGDGVLTWMEDEDYFQFSDDLLLTTTEKLQFRDTAIYINSSADGQLDLVADTEIQIAATTIDINGLVDISGNLSVGGNLDVTGTLDLSDSNFTNVGSLQLDSIAGDGDTDSSITFSGSDVITIATGGSTAATFNASQVTTLSGNLIIPDAGNIGSASDTDAIAIGSDGDITLTQDLELQHDGAILSFGANDEIALTHVHNTGLLLTDSGGTPTLQFHDANESFSSDGSKIIMISGGTTFNMPTSDGTDGQALATDGSGTLSFVSVAANTPSSADGQALGSASLEWSDLFLADAGTIQFGNDQEIRLTHVADVGLTLSHTASGDDKPVVLNLKSEEDELASGEEIGRIDFTAGDSGGTDAITTAASIAAVAEDTFASDNNSTGLAFKLGVSAAATEMFRMDHDGDFKVLTDGSAIAFGANNEIELTHVHNTGLLLTDSGGSPTLQLHDANESVMSDGTNLKLTSGGTAYTIPTSDGSNGQFLKTNGSGVLSFGTVTTTGAFVVYEYTATAAQTSFSGNDDNSSSLSYTAGVNNVLVSVNGVLLDGSDYTATNGTAVVLSAAAAANDMIKIQATNSSSITSTDLNGSELVLDADGDTTLAADTDDTIDIKIAGADDFRFTANTLTALSGSSIVVPAGGLTIGSTAVASTAAELNILDDATVTTAELNIIDGNTSATSTTVADADRVVLNDNGTMVQVAMTDIKTYIGGGTSWQAVKTGNFTAAAGQGVFCDTSSAAFTLTLPASPSIGDEVAFKDYAKTFDTNNLTIARNSSKIEGGTDNLTVDVEGAGNTLVFTDSTQGWLLRNK